MTDAGQPTRSEPELQRLKSSNGQPSSDAGAGERKARSGDNAQSSRQAAAMRLVAKPAPHAPSGFQRTVGAIRTVVPILQKVLPLLDGNVVLALANLLAPRLPQAPPVDLNPLQEGIAGLRSEQQELRGKIADQGQTLKRLGDELDHVKDTSERVGDQQREMADDLHRLRGKVNVFAWVGLVLLIVSLGVNVVLALEVKGILR